MHAFLSAGYFFHPSHYYPTDTTHWRVYIIRTPVIIILIVAWWTTSTLFSRILLLFFSPTSYVFYFPSFEKTIKLQARIYNGRVVWAFSRLSSFLVYVYGAKWKLPFLSFIKCRDLTPEQLGFRATSCTYNIYYIISPNDSTWCSLFLYSLYLIIISSLYYNLSVIFIAVFYKQVIVTALFFHTPLK